MEKELLSTVLQISGQLRILHWQTESFAEHNAFGDTYESLNDKFDHLIEGMVDFFQEAFMAQQDAELANLRDEIVADLNKLKYLLTLK